MPIKDFFFKPSVLRVFWGGLRKFAPVLRIGKFVFVSRYDDVVEVLGRDQDFTISEINGKRMEELGLPFFLGMDNSQQRDQELNLMQCVVKREDLHLVQKLVKNKVKDLTDIANQNGEIDIVSEYARKVPIYLIHEYFGIPVEDESTFQMWMRDLFYHLFLNLTNNKAIKDKAIKSAASLQSYLLEKIKSQKSLITRGEALPDTVLSRLLVMQKSDSWITDDVIRRNLTGLIIGSVDTTNKCACLVMEVLLNNPKAFAKAREAALSENIQLLGKYMLEALRLNPHNPIVIRYSKKDNIILREKPYKISAGSTIFVGIFSAMYDKKYFKDAVKIDIDRKGMEYLHWSYGTHACFGRYINMVQIPELMAGLLRLKNLRPAPGRQGKIEYENEFPNHFKLVFDKH